MENPVGLRFRPTDEEIIDDYLRPKNLESNTSHVDRVISTVTICKYDPWELPSHSMIKLKDQVWCFFSRKENKYERGERQIRKIKSGYWKITGKPKDIIGTNGNRQKIGHKRVLMFRFSNNNPNGSKSDWVMHEYHLLSPNQMMMTYTICKVMFKGDERHISSSSPGSEIEHIHSLIPLVNNSGGSEVTQSLIPHDVNNSGGQSTETEGSSFHSQGLQNPPQSSGFIDVQEEEASLVDANTPSEEWRSFLVDDEYVRLESLQL